MNHSDDANGRRERARPPPPPGGWGRLGAAGAFHGAVGRHIDPAAPVGYYIDFTAKAPLARWPPDWFDPSARRLWVVLLQWALGCYERYVDGQGDEWLDAALAASDYLLEAQEQAGPHAGGWVHRLSYKHTYPVVAPWLSGMAQGEGASLLVRAHRASGETRYAEAALRALLPVRRSVLEGGVAASLGGGSFPQEYPTDPPSHVLNGGIFGLWGCHDVGVGLGDAEAMELWKQGIAGLAASLDRFDTGYWSRYDLYPDHPAINVAHGGYHRLHASQLWATSLLDADPRFAEVATRFDRYGRSRVNAGRALAAKVIFRLAVPRNQQVARWLPWARCFER